MDMNEYQNLAGRTALSAEDLQTVFYRMQKDTRLLPLLNAALGAAGEAGEIADEIKKVVFHGHELDTDHLAKETGDALWYLAYVARVLGFPLGDIAEANIQKLRGRYPAGFSEERSQNREERREYHEPTRTRRAPFGD